MINPVSRVLSYSMKSKYRIISSYMKNYNRLVTRSFATTLTNGVINSLEYPFNRDSIPDETIFIIDGTGLIFLSYFSVEKNLKFGNNIEVENISENLMKNLNISLNSADLKQATLALTTMASMFVSIVKFIKPKYLAIVFDAGSLTFRNTMFPDYKLNRPPKPPAMEPLFYLAPRIFEVLGCRCLKQAYYEADDVMATLGKWAYNRGLNVVHVSQDKDMHQLVSTGIHIMNPRQWEYLGVDEIRRKHGVAPSQLTDLWALMGDVSDNVPGVPGIGEKTGAALIKYFGSIENMVEQLRLLEDRNTWSMEKAKSILSLALRNQRASKDKVLNSLREHVNHLSLYKKIVTLKADVPITTPAGLGFEDFVNYCVKLESTVDKSLKTLSPMSISSKDVIESYSEGNTIKMEELQVLHLDTLNTKHFRYVGESMNAEEDITKITRNLLAPLNSLRLIYNQLDRDL